MLLLRALFCSLFWVNLAVAGVIDPLYLRRADQTTATATTEAAESSSTAEAASSTEVSSTLSSSASASSSVSASASATATATQTSSDNSTDTSTVASSTIVSSATASSTSALNITLFNSTIADGELPLAPELTPGWGVAGIIMLLTGAVHTLIGIKKHWLHVYLSTAFLGSLGTTVLIVYVMSTPISHAVQGAYVVAVVCTGAILGGVSLVFKDITESLGCMLGGFSFAMWLLTLHTGGLLSDSTGKTIFIVAFTIGVFAFYFTHWTRQYALIGSNAFGGATVTVLGVDAFSRAGLKEFWAYIWDLNDNLFPLGADTYPLTKGIRVEIAVTIILFLAGIISQMKLWRVVQERRAKRDAARAEDERALQQEEEKVGRQVEETTARERQQWENEYGGGSEAPMSPSQSSTIDSGVGDMESVKHGDAHTTTHTEEPIEMADLQNGDASAAAASTTVLEQGEKGGAITVHVAQDDYPEGVTPPEEPAEKTVRAVPAVLTPGPKIIPLPFTIPTAGEEDKEQAVDAGDDRTSVATFADEENTVAKRRTLPRRSLAKRLSQSSVELLKRASMALSHGGDDDLPTGESMEELVMPEKIRDDSSSLAATIDGISSCGDDESIHAEETGEEEDKPTIEVKPQLAAPEETEESGTPAVPEEAADQTEQPDAATTASAEKPEANPTETETQSHKARSVVSVDSAPSISLTKDRLPHSLSRVALSYRTNEWAKHLSHADTPEPETLQVEPIRVPSRAPSAVEEETGEASGESTPAMSVKEDEVPRPLNVLELQQTAETGAPPPAAPRLQRALSRQSAAEVPTSPAKVARNSTGVTGLRSGGIRVSAMHSPPIMEEDAGEGQQSQGSDGPRALTPPNTAPVPGVLSCTAPQTLIGKREMLLRSKSQQGFYIGGPITQQVSLDNLHMSSTMPVMPAIPSVSGGASDRASVYSSTADLDDVPMRQRREMMRQQSYASISGGSATAGPAGTPAFDSHQPRRSTTPLTSSAREARLATFRNSVAVDLAGHESTMLANGGRRSVSAASLLLPLSQDKAYLKQSIDTQRNMLLGQKEAEAQRRLAAQQDRERTSRVFEQRMRSGDLMEAHRDAMRRMQASARKGLEGQE